MHTQTKHTPGPWHLRGNQVLTSPRNIIADVNRISTIENQIANARLIEAAPSLYEYIKGKADAGEQSAQDCLLRLLL